ncbi:MAG: GntR family transcriptional regulator [Parvularculales bacterium]
MTSVRSANIKNHGNLPVYLQIAEQLAREISAGILVEGDCLPPEREMALRYGVAVRTLRKSLARLTDLGLLDRRQGSGNFIRKTENYNSIYSFFRLEKPNGGGLPSARMISVDTLAKPADLPDFGNAEFGHRFRRLRFVDEIPAALEEIWLDGSVAPQINTAVISQSMYKFYQEHLGLWITRAEDWVSMSPVPNWQVPPFKLTAGTQAVYVERFGFAKDDRKVEYSRSWFDSAVVSYVARLK